MKKSEIDSTITFSLSSAEKEKIKNTAEKLDLPISLFCRKALKNQIQAFDRNEKFQDDTLSYMS